MGLVLPGGGTESALVFVDDRVRLGANGTPEMLKSPNGDRLSGDELSDGLVFAIPLCLRQREKQNGRGARCSPFVLQRCCSSRHSRGTNRVSRQVHATRAAPACSTLVVDPPLFKAVYSARDCTTVKSVQTMTFTALDGSQG